MAHDKTAYDTHIYGEVNNKTDLKKIFQKIRQDVEEAESRPDLTELYRRAGYLVTLTHSPGWEEKFGPEIADLRKVAEEEFRTTARKINRRAEEIGTEANYDETWGDEHHYKPTESKYKGGAKVMYLTYDLPHKTRGNGQALYPHVKRVYIPGEVKNWQIGTFEKRSGKKVYGVKIEYEKSREGYVRKGYTATRGTTKYQVPPARVEGSKVTFSKIVEIPEDAQNVQLHTGELPQRYQAALQDVR